jgi:hypothetical protein
LSNVRTKLAEWLISSANWLKKRSDGEERGPRFVDLAPTDQADEAGVYCGALTEATDNARVMNIALTGPYGSGKSSIIKSFLKSYKRDVLQISLAAFLPDAAPSAGEDERQEIERSTLTVSRQEIERSILQQMLYGADANRLPLSRFKRIHSPGRWAPVVSLFTVLGLVACWQLIQKRDAIMSGAYFQPFGLKNLFNLLVFAVGGGFLWLIFHQIYIASFGISLKSISLKNIEISPNAVSEESILNRHLDEIIYFFQSTRYDLVVIEDLDRFNNPEIFVTLREINSLVNANVGVRRKVRFLYAIRDDIFVSTDRTKFFEFIVPVIPIINSSNSVDKVLEQGKRLSIDGRLDKQFVREVSRYLNDLRLIQNIFNEYAIYVANLEPEGETNLDATKLLAVLIYKNVFPSDFEKLHRGRGDLADIFLRHDRYITTSETRLTAEIVRLEAIVEASDRQLPEDMTELRAIYAMALIGIIPEGATHIGANQNSLIPMTGLLKSDSLDALLALDHVFVSGPYQGPQRISLGGLSEKLKGATFAQRASLVEDRSSAARESVTKTIADLRTKLSRVRMMKFNEILRESSELLDGMFGAFGENADLARFLVLEGYLDDTYYQYTSLFHSGRLSPSDNKFLIRIRGFSNPDPNFQIDNAREVILAMRDEDFGRNYALNIRIVDCLLADSISYAAQTSRLIGFIASDLDECEEFLAAYYASGTAITTLMSRLVSDWRGFVPAILASPAAHTHVARILSHLPSKQLKTLGKGHPELTDFLASNLAAVLALGIDIAPERLQPLDFEVTDLSTVERHPGFVGILYERGLYELSINNLKFVFRAVLGIEGDGPSRERNYTLVLEAGSEPLLSKVELNFSEYLEHVLLQLPDNRSEGVPAILRILARADVDRDLVLRFLERQTTSLPEIEQIPSDYQAALVEMGRVEPTWDNLLFFIGQETFDADILTGFLDRPHTVATLGHHMLPGGDAAFPLRKFIVENDALSDEAYEAYLKALPTRFKSFPEGLGEEKRKALVKFNRVTLSADALAQLKDDVSLAAAFVTGNIDEFFKLVDELDVSEDLKERLLEADIADDRRLRIIRSMDLSVLHDIPSRAALVGRILARTGVVVENLYAEGRHAVILRSRPLETQIALFNLLQDRLEDAEVRDLLALLPNPMPDIRPGWATPRIEDSDVNRAFASWLQDRKFISSWKQGGIFDDDIRLNMFRK